MDTPRKTKLYNHLAKDYQPKQADMKICKYIEDLEARFEARIAALESKSTEALEAQITELESKVTELSASKAIAPKNDKASAPKSGKTATVLSGSGASETNVSNQNPQETPA